MEEKYQNNPGNGNDPGTGQEEETSRETWLSRLLDGSPFEGSRISWGVMLLFGVAIYALVNLAQTIVYFIK